MAKRERARKTNAKARADAKKRDAPNCAPTCLRAHSRTRIASDNGCYQDLSVSEMGFMPLLRGRTPSEGDVGSNPVWGVRYFRYVCLWLLVDCQKPD